MSDITFGEIDWNEGDDGGAGSKVEFMRLDQGESVVRIMGNPVQFYIHWVETNDGKMKKVNSPIASPELVRRLEDAGWKRKPRWLVKVLDRSDNQFKLLEIGSQIYSGVKALHKNKKWGKVTGYDITIERGPKGSQPLYRVTPDPHEPLSDKYLEQFMAFDNDLNIERLIQPADPAYVCELLGWDGVSSAAEEEDLVSDSDAFFKFQA